MNHDLIVRAAKTARMNCYVGTTVDLTMTKHSHCDVYVLEISTPYWETRTMLDRNSVWCLDNKLKLGAMKPFWWED